MENRFADRYFSIMGDSISTYEWYLPADHPTFYTRRGAAVTGINGYRDTWWGQVITHFGAKLLVNNSWSGSYVCRPKGCQIESFGCSDARSGGLGADGIAPDHILVLLGSNDRGAGLPLTSTDKSDLAVIENAYGLMLDKMRRAYPNAEIWCCTFPITSCSRDPYYVFPDTQMGVPMAQYGELIKKLAAQKSCHLIDLWDPEKLCDTIDGLHPNYQGMTMIADKVIAAMEQTLP